MFRDQLLMVTALDDMTELQHHNNVCVLNCGQAVRDNEHRASVHETVHAGLHDGLRAGINLSLIHICGRPSGAACCRIP